MNLTAREAISDFPLPLGPMMATVLPGVISKETFSRRVRSPLLKETFSKAMVPLSSFLSISPSLMEDLRSRMAFTFLQPALAEETSTRSQPISIIGQLSSLVYSITMESSPMVILPFITSIPPTSIARGTIMRAIMDWGVHQLIQRESKVTERPLKIPASLPNLLLSLSSLPKDFTVLIPMIASLAAALRSARLSDMASEILSPFISLLIARYAITGRSTRGTRAHFMLTLARAPNCVTTIATISIRNIPQKPKIKPILSVSEVVRLIRSAGVREEKNSPSWAVMAANTSRRRAQLVLLLSLSLAYSCAYPRRPGRV